MDKKKRICVIMVNYNNSQLSIDCYKSIVSQKDVVELSIIVVDNNSKVEEKNILKEFQSEHKDFEVLYLDTNIGYFPGMAKGQEYAYSKGEYDFMIIANNDLIYDSNFFRTLANININIDIMVISPDIVTPEGIHQNPHFINRISTIRRIFYRLYYSNWYISLIFNYLLKLFNSKRSLKNKPGYDKEQYIYLGFGACFILTKSFMKSVGIVDNRSFLMGEEALLRQQVETAKGKILYIPKLKVKHLDSATFKKMPSRFAYDNHRKSYKLYKDSL